MSYEKLYQISFAIATLFAFTMFSSNLETTQRVYSAKNEVKASTGVLETKDDRAEDSKELIRQIKDNLKITWKIIPQASAKENETGNVGYAQNNLKQKYSLPDESHSQISVSVKNVERTPEQIYEQVKHLGYREEPTKALISTCKGASLRPDHCILVWLTLMYNEAGNQQNSKACVDRNNCFGIQSWKKSYSSLDEGMENWVQTYNKYWINAEWPEFFYSKNGSLPKSRYCTSETSSWSSIGCPRWLKIASDKWSKLYKIIY